MKDLITKLREYQFPQNIKPHALARQPFANWTDDTIRSALKAFDSIPGKRGAFSDAVRHIRQSAKPDIGENFIRYEAHFNIDAASVETENTIASLGFEPDDFVELHPSCYSRNYTLSYDIPANQRDHVGREGIRASCLNLMAALKNHPGFCFVEAERFPSANIRNYNRESIQATPLPVQRYRVEEIPRNNGEVSQAGYTAASKKIIDIHIKLAGIVSPVSAFDRTKPISNSGELAAALAYVGMYRITSVSGNTIYTAQFADGKKAQEFIDKMDKFLATLSIADSMIYEPCFLLERNFYNGQYAPLCPLLD